MNTEVFGDVGEIKGADRVRQEKADIHHPNDMDACHDRNVLPLPLLRSYFHHRLDHCHTASIFQGSHGNSQRTEQDQKSTPQSDAQLVLPRLLYVLSLWRKPDILLQTYPPS